VLLYYNAFTVSSALFMYIVVLDNYLGFEMLYTIGITFKIMLCFFICFWRLTHS
jgi:hypothetical protein